MRVLAHAALVVLLPLRLALAALVLLTAGACQDPALGQATPERTQSDSPVAAGADLAMPTPMPGFSWIDDSRVAGLPRPGARRELDQDLDFLASEGIDVLVSLTEQPVDAAALAAHGMRGMHLPVRDFHAPTLEQLDAYVAAVEKWNAAGKQVGTHCGAGKGRTGTFLAALLVARGRDADAAIAEIRRLRPGSIETAAQETSVRQYAAWLAERQRVPDDPTR